MSLDVAPMPSPAAHGEHHPQHSLQANHALAQRQQLYHIQMMHSPTMTPQQQCDLRQQLWQPVQQQSGTIHPGSIDAHALASLSIPLDATALAHAIEVMALSRVSPGDDPLPPRARAPTPAELVAIQQQHQQSSAASGSPSSFASIGVYANGSLHPSSAQPSQLHARRVSPVDRVMTGSTAGRRSPPPSQPSQTSRPLTPRTTPLTGAGTKKKGFPLTTW
jgi:hypothetical protein